MQKINLFHTPRIDRGTLTATRFVLALIGLLVLFAALGLWSDQRSRQVRGELAALTTERDTRRAELEALQSRKPPVADPVLKQQISEAWRDLDCCHPLAIEREVFWLRGSPPDPAAANLPGGR